MSQHPTAIRGLRHHATVAVLLLAALCCPGVAIGSDAQATPADPMISVVNRFRAQEGLPALKSSAVLGTVAQAHAVWMGRSRLYGHVGAGGTLAKERVSQAGYDACVVIENLALGHRQSHHAARSWTDAPTPLWMDGWPPRDDLLDPEVREVGAAGARNAHGEWFWVLVMAAPCDGAGLSAHGE